MGIFLTIDSSIFLFINHLPHTPLLNEIALFLSGIGEYGVVWFFFGILLMYRENIKDRMYLISLLAAGFFSWGSSEILLKGLFMRIRPSIALSNAIVVTWPIGFSFPSTHAFLAFALVPLLAHKDPTWRKFFYGLAFAIALSRIYLGHHYPSDVLIGGLLGYLLGRSMVWWYHQWERPKIIHTHKRTSSRKRKHRV
jgi:undecaprenyl-diphosphatase